MFRFGLRAGSLALLVVLAIGSYATVTASAEPGPFLHHREVGGKGAGEKIEAKAAEGVASSLGEAFLLLRIAETEVSISIPKTQIKGIIYNNALQGQAKLLTTYFEPTIVKPVLKECTAVIGENDTSHAFGHLVWKWNGEKKQLEEVPQKAQSPDWIFLPSEIQEGATELPKGTILSISFKGSGCGLLAGAFALKGDYGATIQPQNVEEWSTTETQTPTGLKLHFWNGKAPIGAETSEFLGRGSLKLETTGHQGSAPQEIARFEK